MKKKLWRVLAIAGFSAVCMIGIKTVSLHAEQTDMDNHIVDTSQPSRQTPMNEMDQWAHDHKDVLSDGTVQIGSAENTAKVVDVQGGSTKDTANVQLYQTNATEAQAWNVSHDAIGYVTFTNINSGKALDVNGAQTVNGTNVQQFRVNGTLAQKWVVIQSGGYYQIFSALKKDMVLDLRGALASNGTNIQLYQANGTDAQKWAIYAFSTDKKQLAKNLAGVNASVIANGEYQIISQNNGNFFLDVSGGSVKNGANVQLYRSNGTAAQWWIVRHDADGYITLTSKRSGKVLDVAGGLAIRGRNVQQFGLNGTLAQKWIVIKTRDGYEIVSALDPDYRLDVFAAGAKNGANVNLFTSNETKAQIWQFKQMTTMAQRLNYLAALNRNAIGNGNYTISTSMNNGYGWDVIGASKQASANVRLYANNYTKAQIFAVSHDSNGYVGFKNINSGMMIDVTGAQVKNGANIQQYNANGTAAQKWIVIKNNNGYEIVSALNEGYVIDLNGALVKNTQNITVFADNNTRAQRWNIIAIRSGYVYKYGIDISEHNGNIDLSNYKDQFVIIRVSYGTYMDNSAVRNMNLCEQLGIPYGVYCYSYALNTNDALAEADYLLNAIKGRTIQCGVWFDMEDADNYKANNNAFNGALMSSMCQTFCNRIQNSGYYTGIYSSSSWFQTLLTGLDAFDKWVANWGTNDGTLQTRFPHLGTIQQFTSVPLDRNVMYVDPSTYLV